MVYNRQKKLNNNQKPFDRKTGIILGTENENGVKVSVNPGICGFTCIITASKIERRSVEIKITESECKHIKEYSEKLKSMGLKELFMPMTKNPVYIHAQSSGCHPSCPIPVAALKAAEVALEMALPRDVEIRFV
jgi:hypothetical protein